LATKEVIKRGGILKIPQGNEAAHLDPHLIRSSATAARMLGGYQRLIRYKTGPDVGVNAAILVPDLAESWEISKDGKTYTFHLRKGVKWHNLPPVNGREFVAEDVVYTYDRIANTAGSANAGWFSTLDKMRAVGKYTVEITLKEPYVAFLLNMADTYAVITPKEVVDADGNLKKRVIGTGPFILTERVSNIVTKLRRNPDYWERGVPYLDGIDLFTIPDPSATLAAFRGGQIDLASSSDKEEVASILRSNPRTQVLRRVVGLSWSKIHWRTDKPPYDNIKLRQAFSVAMDRQGEIDIRFGGEGTTVVGPMPAYPGFVVPLEKLGEASKFYKRDVKYAKQLLAEAGYPNGGEFPYMVANTDFLNRAQFYYNSLLEAGIKLKIKVIDFAEYLGTGYIGKYEGAANGGTNFPPDPGEFFHLQYHSASAVYNQSHVKDPLVDKMIEEQKRTLDPDKRIKIIQDLQMHLADKFYYIALPGSSSNRLMSPRVRGWAPTINQNDSDVFRYVWFEGEK